MSQQSTSVRPGTLRSITGFTPRPSPLVDPAAASVPTPTRVKKFPEKTPLLLVLHRDRLAQTMRESPIGEACAGLQQLQREWSEKLASLEGDSNCPVSAEGM